ncbi:BT_3928 family protein [Flavobacterium crassostreae]|uniref:DoxX family protein n=1 Tax=Flavobacterium crassostreae TaxID=1763534 RepID=A0A1B9E9K3_9FLAO|nr:BT_3928 family protein [Flavobacterium crassostreae]OCB78634.1 DoxX family protein [Flavobacterium crassostreae]
MKNAITQFSRIFVGLLFIISGLIKLNDPVGFSYKLAEYFSEPVFNLLFLVPFSLGLALFLVLLEVVLGVLLLLGYKSKITIWSLLVMIVLFSFLTFYSAYFDVVKDCGCFGDALKLTPWQSFTKDMVLLFFILILACNVSLVKPFFNTAVSKMLTYASIVVCMLLAVWVLNHLPIIDFRPYSVGTNITQGMQIPEGAPQSVVEMVFIYNVNGVDTPFKEADLMDLPEGATFVDRKDHVISEGYVPPIHDFTMIKENTDYKDELLQEPKVLLAVSYDLTLADQAGMSALQKLNKVAVSKGYKMIGMTNSSQEEITKAKEKYHLDFDYYTCDAITLKTIERANPSIIVLQKGTIIQKVHYNDISDLKW